MSFEIIFVFILLLIALILFSTGWVSFDIAALIIAAALMAGGILTPREGLSGFSNPATVTIAAMFILSEGIRRTGILGRVGDYFTQKLERNFTGGFLQLLLFISVSSAFINNTAIVVIFIPVFLEISRKVDISPSKLLMPLSFAGIFGGICTLIGTSTNILVSSIAEGRGLSAFSMFELTPMGLIFLAAGFIYLFTLGIDMIPGRRKNEDLTKGYGMQNYLTDLVIEPESHLIGNTLDEEQLTRKLDLDVIRIFKRGENRSAQRSDVNLDNGDVLRIRGSAEEIQKLMKREDLSLKPTREWLDVDLKRGRDALVEAVIAPDSTLEGKKLNDVEFFKRFGAIPLAVQHHGSLQQEAMEELTLSGGDSILFSMSRDRIDEIYQDPSFVLASEIDTVDTRENKSKYALPIIFFVVAAAALNIMPIVQSAILGVILMIISGCITAEEAYKAVNWKVIVLLAGVIPLGMAMDKTGAAALMADKMVQALSDLGPRALVSGYFLLTMAITAIMSNNASAALLAPIAIQTAESLQVNAEPFLFAVTFAASLSFITPFGYQTNTLIYGAGQYKFLDFTKIGLPLNFIFWILGTIFIPVIWPF